MTTIMTEAQIAKFYEDGFLIVENFIDAETCALAAERFGPLFSGVYETGRKPDGMNFGQGDAAEAHNKQIDNAWKSDYNLGSIVAESSCWPGFGRVNACRWSTGFSRHHDLETTRRTIRLLPPR